MKRRRHGTESIRTAAVLLAWLAAASAMGGDVAFVVAERGESAAVEIVTGANPAAEIASGARIFADHVERMTGVKLPVVAVPSSAPRRIVVTAATDDPVDGFAIETTADVLTVAGTNPHGAAYGLFELLERFGGCGWYSKTFSVVPETARFEVPVGFRDRQKAAFECREDFWYDQRSDRAFAALCRDHPCRFGSGLWSAHTLAGLLPSSEYFEAHPEYFALRDGKRIPDQPCLTSPEVLAIVTSNVLSRIAADPSARYYGVSQNDNRRYCQCERCAAVDAEEGGTGAGTVIRFVNAIADEVARRYPGKCIETLAYEYSRKPPKTRPRPNVMVCLCSIECDFAHPLATSANQANADFRRDISGWAELCDRLYVWDYTTDFTHYLYPFPNEGVLQSNLRFFRDHKVRMIFEQGAFQGRHGDLAELKSWLLAKLMWNPDADAAELTRRFVTDYYGAAAPMVTEYLAMRAGIAAGATPLGIYEKAECDRYPMEWLERAAELWRAAEAAVKDDPARLYNVRMGSLSVDYARIRRMQAAAKPEDAGKLRDLCRRFLELSALAGSGGGIRLSEQSYLEGVYRSEIKASSQLKAK